MLRPDVVVAEGERLAQGQLKGCLRVPREGDLSDESAGLRARSVPFPCKRADMLERHVEVIENSRGEAYLFTHESDQQMIGTNLEVPHLSGLVLRMAHRHSRTLRESFEHQRPPSSRMRKASSYNSGAQIAFDSSSSTRIASAFSSSLGG